MKVLFFFSFSSCFLSSFSLTSLSQCSFICHLLFLHRHHHYLLLFPPHSLFLLLFRYRLSSYFFILSLLSFSDFVFLVLLFCASYSPFLFHISLFLHLFISLLPFLLQSLTSLNSNMILIIYQLYYFCCVSFSHFPCLFRNLITLQRTS
jgi:hypothetical protein